MAGNVNAGSAKLMAVKAAKASAERGIMESLAGLKVRSKEEFEDQFRHNVTIDTKSAALIKGVEFTEIIYDKEKGVAQVTARLNANKVKAVLGDIVDYKGKAITRIGFGASNATAAKPLLALRAAELDAYKEMAKRIIGAEMTSKTKVKNFLTTSDKIRINIMAAIYGSEVEAYGWEGDDAFVTIKMAVGHIRDVLGQDIEHEGEIIRVTGYGTMVDDYDPDAGDGVAAVQQVRVIEKSINMPMPSK
ncbi:MAG: hypothetical protein ABW166_18765 [Sedimenticola sp.]